MKTPTTMLILATMLTLTMMWPIASLAQAPQAQAKGSQAKGSQATQSPPTPASEVLFRDIAEQAGVQFEHRSAPEKKYILESMAGGVALLDVNNDGWLDIYLVNSLTVATASQTKTAPSALYLNKGLGADGELTFENIASKAGVAYPGWGMGVCVADVDGDGWQDFYVTAVGSNHLYRNQGDGTFIDTTRASGLGAGGWSTGCGFADYDRDGHLDLFVSRYVEVDLDNLPVFGQGKTCQFRGIAVQCGPRGLPGTTDLLFHNDGNGHFTDVSKQAGVDDPDGYFGLGIAWFDFNSDGWLDLFVANDSNPNFFYENKGKGRFEEAAFPLGVAVSEDGGEQGGMGVAIGDYENKGRPDLFVTNFAEEYNALYQNKGDYFTDVSFRSASAPASLPFVGWGTAFLDFDNDGWLDLIVVNGHVYPQLDNANLGASAAYRQRRLLYRNLGLASPGAVKSVLFEEVAGRFGPILTDERVSRGLAVGDLDNDGRLDVVINNLGGKAQVLHNQMATASNWLLVKLTGKAKLTSAIGATVTVRTGELTQSRIVRSGTGYLSQDDLRQHFGLGTASKVDALEVRWPSGSITKRTNIDANRLIVIAEDAS